MKKSQTFCNIASMHACIGAETVPKWLENIIQSTHKKKLNKFEAVHM